MTDLIKAGSPMKPINTGYVLLRNAHVPVVVAVNEDGSPISNAVSDRELVVTTYSCKTAFTGASIGDTITNTQIMDVSANPPSTLSTVWRNQSTSTDFASAPSSANLALTGSTALTDAQLRAAAVVIQAQWVDGAYTLDASGNLVSETQVNTSTNATRTRTWTYTASGSNTVATPGAWV